MIVRADSFEWVPDNVPDGSIDLVIIDPPYGRILSDKSRLAEIMIETSSNPGELVLDFFAGSGSTGVAAKKLGREFILVEAGDGPMHAL